MTSVMACSAFSFIEFAKLAEDNEKVSAHFLSENQTLSFSLDSQVTSHMMRRFMKSSCDKTIQRLSRDHIKL